MAEFGKGKGAFLIAGTWVTADLPKRWARTSASSLMPGKDPNSPVVARRRVGLPFAITSASKHPDVAAAYIDFITDANAAKVLTDTDNLPAMKGAPTPAGGLSADVATRGRSSTRPTA